MSASDAIRQRVLRATQARKALVQKAPLNTPMLSHSSIQRAVSAPHALPSGDMLHLQRLVGNQQVNRMLRKKQDTPRRGRMTVGASNDRFEHEADSVAAHVTQGDHATVQRSTSTGAEGGSVSRALEQRMASAKGGGAPAPEAVRRAMEERTGADFSNVRVHHNREAHGISAALGAKAATHGNHIFLARDQSPNDARLMAHELTHTIQQGAVKAGNEMGQDVTSAERTPEIQRDDDEDEIKKLKGKRTKAKVGAGALKALDWLTTAPLHLIDELSITDLHLKDFGKFVSTGKTRRQRQKEKGMEGLSKFTKGSTKRAFGRTGLRGYLSGTKTHKMMYTNALNGFDLPWKGKYNPFTQMSTGVGELNKKSNKYSDQIYQLRQKRQQQMQDNGDGEVGNMTDDEKDVLDVLSTTVEDDELENA